MSNGVYGLLGANGAGKTTLMRMICTVLNSTSGEILFNGTSISDSVFWALPVSTQWHIHSECLSSNTNKKACSNSTFCREQKRAAFPKKLRKSGPKSRAQRFKSTDFAKILFDIFFSDFKNWAQKTRKSFYFPLQGHKLSPPARERNCPLPHFFLLPYAGNGMISLSGGSSFGCFSSGCMALSNVPMSR